MLLVEAKYILNKTTSNDFVLIILDTTIIALAFKLLYKITKSKLLEGGYISVKSNKGDVSI